MTVMYTLDQLVEDPDNIRTTYDETALQELADSISEFGLINALSVVVDDQGQPVIKAGHRRYRAMQLLVAANKMTATDQVPCDVWESTSDAFSLTLMLIENLQREDISPLDEARGFMALATTHKMKQKDIARTIGKSQAHISKRMALLTLPEPVQDNIAKGTLALDVAYDLATLPADDAKVLLKQAAKDPSKIMTWEISNVRNKIERRKAGEKFKAEIAKRMLDVVADAPTDMSKYDISIVTDTNLADYVPAKGDILQAREMDTVLWLYRKITPAMLKAKEKQQAEHDAANLAARTPYDDWEDAADELEDGHARKSKLIFAQRQAEFATEITALPNKDLLRAIIEQVQQSTFSGYDAVKILDALGITFVEAGREDAYSHELANMAKPVLDNWIGEDPLTRILQARLIVNPVGATATRIVAATAERHPLPELVLPPEPWQQADGTWTTEPHPDDEVESDFEADVADAVEAAVAALDHEPSPDEMEAIEAEVRLGLGAQADRAEAA